MAQTIATPAADFSFKNTYDINGVCDAKSTAKVSPNANETVFVDTETAVAAPTTIRRSVSYISNIYTNANQIPVASRNYIASGSSMLVQVNETWTVTDSVTGLTSYIPVSGHMVIKMSDHPAITSIDAFGLATRVLGCFGTGGTAAATVTPTAGMSKMRKGITNY